MAGRKHVIIQNRTQTKDIIMNTLDKINEYIDEKTDLNEGVNPVKDIGKIVNNIQSDIKKLKNWHATIKPDMNYDRVMIEKAENTIVAIGGSLIQFSKKYMEK